MTALATDPDGGALPAGLGAAVDPDRIGAYGHSVGGATAAEVLHDDRRVRAAANLEGYLDYQPERRGGPSPLLPVARYGVDRPLLLLGTDGFRDDRIVRSWTAMRRRCPATTYWRQLSDAMHWVFTDYGVEAPQFQAAGLMSAADRRALVGAIRPTRSVPAIHDRLTRFFARHL